MKYRKIYIIGGPGSGKSYIARKLSSQYNITAYDLDDLFWDRHNNAYGTKARDEDRNNALDNILNAESWIIEGVYYRWVGQAFKDADLIIILTTPKWIRLLRISRRFIKRKLGIISSKKEKLRDFWDLVKWNKKFDSDNLIRIRKFIADHESKVVECKDIRDIVKIINNTKQPVQKNRSIVRLS